MILLHKMNILKFIVHTEQKMIYSKK